MARPWRKPRIFWVCSHYLIVMALPGKNLETLPLVPRHIGPPMKKTIIVPALVAVLGFALASAPVTIKAQAATTTSTSTTTPTKPAKTAKKKSEYTQFPKGSKISAIDASSVTLTTAKGDLKLAIDAKTGFEVDKKKSDASAFAVGDVVTGSYSTGADGSLTAHNIRKKTAK